MEAILLIYALGVIDPVRIPIGSMPACEAVAQSMRERGHTVTCISRPDQIRPCASCGAPIGPIG